jgi:RimJ/RimL family protein N-acetyltransferase
MQWKINEKSNRCCWIRLSIDWPGPEIQWGLARRFWGIGYAAEGVKAAKRMTRHYLPGLSLISVIHPDNINSINLAKQWVRTLKGNIISEMILGIYRHSNI